MLFGLILPSVAIAVRVSSSSFVVSLFLLQMSVPAHGMAAVEPVKVDCCRIKGEPGLLPLSTFRSEFLRLRAEAKAVGHPSGPTWIDRRCRQFIRICYGQKCYLCGKTIDLHWDVEPINRFLHDDGKRAAERRCGTFHKLCWKSYQTEKNKQRRRDYEEAKGGCEPAMKRSKKEACEDDQHSKKEAVEINPCMPPAALGEVM